MRSLLKMIGAVLLSVVLVAAVEGALRLGGFEARIAGGGDPVLNPLPLFRAATGPDGTARMERHDAAFAAFRSDKPANGFRVFVIGDSSAYGYPFGPEFAFSRFLQERLAAAMPDRTVEVVNAAMNGVASWHARAVLEEIARYRPDVIIVQVGHGDWITPEPAAVNPMLRAAAQLRFYQLAVVAAQKWQRWWQGGPLSVERIRSRAEPYGRARDRARGTETLTAQERERIITRFRDNLRAIVAAGQAAGATVILDGLAQNLSDFPPGASRHRHDLSEAERQRWREAIRRADERLRAQDWQGALTALGDAERIDAEPAILHYLRGLCLQEVGDYPAAAAEFQIASDRDGAPLGALSVFDEVLRAVAQDSGAQFVDVAAALHRSSPNGLVGYDVFFDYVHPSIAGHATISRVLAEAMGVSGDDGHVSDPATLTAADRELQRKAYAADTLLYLQLGWYDRAIAELNGASQQYPELVGVRELVEKLKVDDPVKPWDDFPASPE